MNVITRSNKIEPVNPDEITKRLSRLSQDLDCDYIDVAAKTAKMLYDGIHTREIDNISAKTAEQLKIRHPDYSILAARILIDNLHRQTPPKFSASFAAIQHAHNKFKPSIAEWVAANAEKLDSAINDSADFQYRYTGITTLSKNYLYADLDRPQYMLMRVAIQLFWPNVDKTIEYYRMLSDFRATHATPTLFNSCTNRAQLLSCFLLGVGDNIESIMDTLKNASIISKWGGGIGVHMHNIRGEGELINSTSGRASGIIPQLRLWNDAARCWNQGGKRRGAIAVYLEIWHSDIRKFLELLLKAGDENDRARDLHTAVWLCDLFIERVKANEKWSLFSENTAPGLSDVWGNEFKALYERYESQGRATATVMARDVFNAICRSIAETSHPYVLFKDSVNRKSNQQNVGCVKSSNLCTEITEWSNDDSYACCTLASINLRRFVTDAGDFDFAELQKTVALLVRGLNSVIDRNYYPVVQCINNNLQLRPIGIGVQGLADCFAKMDMVYCSDEAQRLEKRIFENIYYAALVESNVMARESDETYQKFMGSPTSRGILQFDMWMQDLQNCSGYNGAGDLWSWARPELEWERVKANIAKWGLYNSLLVALMPTVATAQIMGNNDSFEPFAFNYNVRRTLVGDFTYINEYLQRDLIKCGLWKSVVNKFIENAGNIQNVEEIPQKIREKYKTVWDMSPIYLAQRSAVRGAYVCQSQSLNVYFTDATASVIAKYIVNAHKLGLKTASYYSHVKPAAEPVKVKFKVESSCTRGGAGGEGCESCSG